MNQHQTNHVALALASISACSDAPKGPTPPLGGVRLDHKEYVANFSTQPASAAEEALIRRIAGSYRGADAATMEKLLRDPRSSEVRTSNKALQPLFDSLNTVRNARHAVEAAAMKDSVDSYRASVVLVDRLPPGATAIVIRRDDKRPRDVILLGADRATPEEFGPAIQALVKLRRSARKEHSIGSQVVLHGGAPMSRWNKRMLDQAKQDLAVLRSSPAEMVDGIGLGRRVDIFVAK